MTYNQQNPHIDTVDPEVEEIKSEDELLADEMTKFKRVFELMSASEEEYNKVLISQRLFKAIIKPRLFMLRTPKQNEEVITLTDAGPVLIMDKFSLNIFDGEREMIVSTYLRSPDNIELAFSEKKGTYGFRSITLNGAKLMNLFGIEL